MLERIDPDDVTWRRRWLCGVEYSPQPFEHLARVYRENGHDREAVTISIARERNRGPHLHPAGRAWNAFLGVTVGYGYRPYQLLYWLIPLFLAGFIVFSQAAVHGAVLPTDAGTTAVALTCTSEYPCFSPWLFSLERLLPVVDLQQVKYWRIDASAPFGELYSAYMFFASLAGWVLATGLVGGLANTLRRTN